jgi:very-short-patch-repair endonuclease
MLWDHLRKGRLMGYKFRRQHVVRKYILDFFCPSAKLGIELDGKIHDKQAAYDSFRSEGLSQFGIHILRFPNERVLSSVETVVSEISQVLNSLMRVTPPPQAGEAGRGT